MSHPNPRIAALIEKAKANHAASIAANKAMAESIRAKREAHRTASQSAEADQQQASEADAAPAINLHLAPAAIAARQQSVYTATAVELNERQQEAIELGLQGKSFCLIGAAGTGKTTTTQELIALLERASHVRPIATSTKHLMQGAPGIVIVGFTNKAVNNIRKKLPAHLQNHCITIHKLLEYAPQYYEVVNGTTGALENTMRFEPSRHGGNPLPHISTLISEESSMIGTSLFGQELAALKNGAHTQFIFLGDLNQIPPVFGPSILGFKLLELPVIELTHVYRQALLSPIISLATAIRLNHTHPRDYVADTSWDKQDAMPVPARLTEKVIIDRGEHGILTIHPWKRRVSNRHAIKFMESFLPGMIDNGTYNPDEDMILCPFNKSFGTVELNKIIADHLAKKRNEIVYEVIARFMRSYWAIGDRVLVDRHEAVITKIVPTTGYTGNIPQTASTTLNRWGFDPESGTAPRKQTAEEILNTLESGGDDESSKNLASHSIHVFIPDTDEHKILTSAGDINNLLMSYVLTVHKSQGSEWQKVFLFLHNSHASLLSRELLYTAVTRAKHELYIICEADINPYENSLIRAAKRPVIPGVTLADKLEFFKNKAESMQELKELQED